MRHVGRAPAPRRGRAIRGCSRACPDAARRRWGAERGAALLELAFIMPILGALLLGVTTGGLAYNHKLSMTNAVREGARFGATLTPASVSPPNTWLSAVASRTVEVSAGDLTSAEVCVKLVREAGATDANVLTSSCPASMTADEPATPANLANGDCVVKVWAQRGDQLQVLFFSSNLTLKAKSVARYENTTC